VIAHILVALKLHVTVLFNVQKGWIFMQNDPILATFDTTPSPHWQINAASLILAFAHIHGEAGTPTLGIRSALVSRNGPVLCAERVDFYAKGWKGEAKWSKVTDCESEVKWESHVSVASVCSGKR
jgi:hypothetical protein